MKDTTLKTIRQHILDNEDSVEYPYLDIKGNLTIGAGFKIETEEEFLSLPLKNEKTGDVATDEEKRDAYQHMKTWQDRWKLGLEEQNLKADQYENGTTLRMEYHEQEEHLNREIKSRVDDIKTDVGADVWDKLSDGQKAVAVDIHYANGSLDDFPAFKEAMQNGDVEAMAQESTFYTDKATGRRDLGRLVRNRSAITGENSQAARENLDDQLNGQGAETPSSKDTSDMQPGRQPGNEQDAAGGGGEEGEALRPEVRRFLDDLKQPVDPVSEIMLKDQRDWTEDELARVQGSDLYQSPSSPRRDEAYGKVRDWYVHHYGDGPAGRDETGRLVPPEYRVTPKQVPVVARSGDGRPVLDGVMEAGAKVADMAGKRGLATAVRGVQAGLNLLNRQGSDGGRKTRLLKPDGTFGPKTKQALQDSVMEQGSQKVENALAMGGFRNLMDNKRGQARGGLAEAAHDSFQPLFEKPTSHRPDDRAPTPWGMVLQDTINDAGTETFGEGFETVRADGWIGPKTVKAFDAVYRPTGADGFMKKLADNFGFF